MDACFPKRTGEVVRLLSVPEFRLTNLERLGKLSVPLVCGRRAWMQEHVLAAAKLLGTDTPTIRNLCQPQPCTPSKNDAGSR